MPSRKEDLFLEITDSGVGREVFTRDESKRFTRTGTRISKTLQERIQSGEIKSFRGTGRIGTDQVIRDDGKQTKAEQQRLAKDRQARQREAARKSRGASDELISDVNQQFLREQESRERIFRARETTRGFFESISVSPPKNFPFERFIRKTQRFVQGGLATAAIGPFALGENVGMAIDKMELAGRASLSGNFREVLSEGVSGLGRTGELFNPATSSGRRELGKAIATAAIGAAFGAGAGTPRFSGGVGRSTRLTQGNRFLEVSGVQTQVSTRGLFGRGTQVVDTASVVTGVKTPKGPTFITGKVTGQSGKQTFGIDIRGVSSSNKDFSQSAFIGSGRTGAGRSLNVGGFSRSQSVTNLQGLVDTRSIASQVRFGRFLNREGRVSGVGVRGSQETLRVQTSGGLLQEFQSAELTQLGRLSGLERATSVRPVAQGRGSIGGSGSVTQGLESITGQVSLNVLPRGSQTVSASVRGVSQTVPRNFLSGKETLRTTTSSPAKASAKESFAPSVTIPKVNSSLGSTGSASISDVSVVGSALRDLVSIRGSSGSRSTPRDSTSPLSGLTPAITPIISPRQSSGNRQKTVQQTSIATSSSLINNFSFSSAKTFSFPSVDFSISLVGGRRSGATGLSTLGFTPSLTASAFNITGFRNPRFEVTGLDIRPVPKRRRKKS